MKMEMVKQKLLTRWKFEMAKQEEMKAATVKE
jgi:hypothetical protein